ncbi:hypothetical protein MUY35_03615 [Aliiroseovarius sp. S1339]|uniref:hypothetical protein n=1 Tax=Aliiroseovarius sp. S1339 TaxID=2936990 RepID=UPI0020BDA0C2|nr:hypothetical protein [Aliiroseovarius sp. S1339]MCK8462934.1 hypothetical protein [Aliiroseovarius sp. S1339]
MARLLSTSLRRLHRRWTARRKTAARTRYLDGQALSELGVPAAVPKTRLRDLF